MSDYQSSEGQSISEQNNRTVEKEPFHYDYYLSNSLDVLDEWKASAIQMNLVSNTEQRTFAYLQKEFPAVSRIQKFRTADVIRTKSFIHMFKRAFIELSQEFNKLFDSKAYLANKQQSINLRVKQSILLQERLSKLLTYLETVMDQGLCQYYTNDNQQKSFEENTCEILEKLYTYICNPKLLWDINGAEYQLINVATTHAISLGGNQNYYKNIMRNILKRNWQLKQVYDQLLPELRKQKIQNFQKSDFLVRMISEVMSLQSAERLTDKQKREFIDCLKGLYFLQIEIRKSSLFYEYLFQSLHLDVLTSHRMFKDYQQLQQLYISVLKSCKNDASLMDLVYTLQMQRLRFDKRKRVPQIENQVLDIVFNYIAVVKNILEEQKIFDDIASIPLEKGYVSSRYLIENRSINGLIGLLMAIQQNSKDAFSLGDISVHKIYLKMSEIIKQIYLSYQHSNWLFPTDILLYIPLRYFMQTSDDIKTDVKKTLFMMVQAINEDRMPHKISYIDGNILREKVRRSEYLQVILYFLQECSNQEEYINLPQTIPTNLQTSILYIKSLQMKLNQKEPTPDQKPYVTNMLKNCQKYKLTINFRWYNTIESIDDREVQFNIEKGMTQDWMRQIYRGTINLREQKQIKSHFDKYLKGNKDQKDKGLPILDLASIFKYCHEIDLDIQIPQKSIKEEDLFLLLQQIKMLMSIHFDIFDLNRDQEASLNYIHVCLNLYNSCYKQTPYNQAYMLIMQKIMKPYLAHPNSSLQTFKTKYLGFFEKWLYSFQIGSIFQQLRSYIQLKGEDQTCRQDIINKIRMVAEFIDNKQNITKNIKLADLTELIVLFATSISRQAHPQVYIQSVQLFCLFLNTFTEVKKQASIDFMIDSSLLSDSNVVREMLNYIKQSSKLYKSEDVSMLNSLIQNLVDYMDKVGFKTVNDILITYVTKQNKSYHKSLDQLLEKMFKEDQKKSCLLNNVFRLIILIKKRHQQTKEEQIAECFKKLKRIDKSLQNIGQNESVFQENFKFLEIVFIDDVVNQLSKTQIGKDKEFNTLARQILHFLIKSYGKNDDLIYFAQKLDYIDLIVVESKGPINPRQQALLIDLMISNRNKGNATELIKKIVRESNKLSQISDKVIGLLTKQKDKIHSHHMNKFIHVNNRYPQEKIEQFIIENIGCQRNVAAVKIKQQYLINDLRKKLEKVPKNICEELLFKPIKSQQNQKLIDFISDIFQKLLYLPIKKFQNVKIKQIEQINQQNQDWNTQSEGQNQEETKEQKKQRNKSEKASSKGQYKSNQSDFIEDQEAIHQPNGSQSNSEQMSEQSEGYVDRADFLDIFTNEDTRKDLDLYNQFMIKREELDVLIESKYQELSQGCVLLQNQEVEEKIMKLSSLLLQMEMCIKLQVIAKMPQNLYHVLRQYGLDTEITPEAIARKERMQKIVTKPPKFMGQLFSDRSESDDSNIIEDDNQGDDMQEQQVDDSQMNEDNCDSEYSESHQHRIKSEKQGYNKSKGEKFVEDAEQQLPGLIPSYSKIQQEINGAELKTDQLIKILEISIYWLLHLPESQTKSKHITSYYMQILSSNFGQLFFESFMTILRFDQNSSNLQNFVAKLEQSKTEKIEIGLQQIIMQTAVNNILYFIKYYQDQNRDNEGYSNILFKESGILLPIAQQMITKLDLPIQNNCITLLIIYIQTNRAKIRNSISDLDFTIVGTELTENKTQYHLKYSEMVRVIEKIWKNGSNNKIWEMIEENMNLKVKSISKLFSCIKGYGQHLYKKLQDVGYKIMKTIKSAQLQLQKHQHKDHQMLHNIENTHHIISKLVSSCKQQIKQFYYVNKFTIKKLMQDQSIDIYEQIESVQTVPNKLVKNKDKVFKNKELIKLVEAMVYFIKMLKDQFYGKIEDKLFAKLIHYPKMIIQAVWYYIFIFAKHKDYKWTTPSEIELFLKQYPFIGSYKFNNLQEVFNLVVFFLNLQPFCTNKFKQFFLPILMKNPKLARQIPLMFKVPRTGEDQEYDTQSIVVTRRCSFDMAFYQVTGQAIQVEFYGQQGSDHGGLVRQLMIGWKGRGVGEQAFFIGKILGISFKQGVPYGGNLDIGMFVAITNYNVTIDFLKQVDPQIYKSLKYIRDNDPEPLYLRFVVEHNINGNVVEYELVEGGRHIDLVQANKHKYLEEYTKKYYYLGRQKELKELKHGFNTVVYPEYAEIFTPFEMLKQIRGEEVVDVKMLISKAKYEGYSSDSNIIKWFWSIVQTFDQQKMNSFIQFVTGSPKITVYNSNFSITIQKVYDIQCLPVAHTCFNTMDLPEYSTKQILQKKLLTAILQGNYSFGIL